MTKSGKTNPARLSPRTEYFIERHGSVWLVWVLLLFLSWSHNSTKLLRGELSSNDDYMRMVEIRDWLSGQNWFDMHQYRLNPVDPLYSHWSRISDVLIGGPIKLLTPLLGQAKAELVTVIAYPSILMLVYLYLATALTGKLTSNRAAPVVAAFMLALSFGALSQFGMGRIDHHGLQIIIALASCWFIVTSIDKSKNLILAGVLCGLALYIGIESAPFVAGACISVALIWVFKETDVDKKIRYFGLALAATTVTSLLISTPSSRWFTPSCDALSVVYIQLTLGIAGVMWGASYLSFILRKPMLRLVAMSLFGIIVILLTLILFPHCLFGPYANLDPRLVEIWLSNVAEAGNFIKFIMSDLVAGSAAIILPILAILGYIFAARFDGRTLQVTERTLVIFVVMTMLFGLMQTRLMFIATALSIPLAAYLLLRALEWARKFKPKALRLLIRTGLIIALAPVTLPMLLGLAKKSNSSPNTDKTKTACISQPVLSALHILPKGTALTQIDLGAPILHFTDLSVTSAPYHRNNSGILAALDMFIEDELTAKQAAAKMQVDYVIACTESSETTMMLKYGSTGMLAQLKSGNVPNWLEKVELGSGDTLLVFRVNTKLLE